MQRQLAPGRLVLATPSLLDPNFDHTVVLLLEHGDEGSLGVVVNRPSDVGVVDVLDDWNVLACEPRRVFVGGPVQPEGLLALARTEGDVADIEPVAAGVGVVDLHADPRLLTGSTGGIRVFAGHAGWGPGQLEEELAAGSWFVVEGDAADVFASDPEALWLEVLSRQGGVFRTIPEDPSLN